MGSRTWIKVYCDKWLEGTLREENPDIRGVWIDLLTLAGAGCYGDSGEIKLSNGIGFTDKQISEILVIKLSLWRRAKRRFLQTNRIKITEKGAICIINWTKYQSEYDRQKPHRQASKVQEPIDPGKYTRGKYGHMVRTGPESKEYTPTADYPDLEKSKV